VCTYSTFAYFLRISRHDIWAEVVFYFILLQLVLFLASYRKSFFVILEHLLPNLTIQTLPLHFTIQVNDNKHLLSFKIYLCLHFGKKKYSKHAFLMSNIENVNLKI